MYIEALVKQSRKYFQTCKHPSRECQGISDIVSSATTTEADVMVMMMLWQLPKHMSSVGSRKPDQVEDPLGNNERILGIACVALESAGRPAGPSQASEMRSTMQTTLGDVS